MNIVESVQFTCEIWGAVVCIILTICVIYTRHFDFNGAVAISTMMMNNCMVCIADALAWAYRGSETTLGYYIVRISNPIVFVLSLLGGVFISRYIHYVISSNEKDHSPRWMIPVYILYFISVIIVLLSLKYRFLYDFDDHNRYYRGEYYWILEVIGLIMILINLLHLVGNHKKIDRMEYIACIFYLAVPFFAVFVQIFFYGLSIATFSYTVCQIFIFIVYEQRYTNRLVELEKERNEERIKMLREQISPHFIFNSLLSIQELCLEDPPKASYGIKQFAKYLRGNIEAMNSDDLIPFEQELSYIKEYIELENLDPANDIKIDYFIEYDDFSLPLLVVEPLIENAVRHGIAYRSEGIIELHSRRVNREVVVTVKDNAVGNCSETEKQSGHRSVAINNIKERLKLQCKGHLEIKKEDGWTVIDVIIPI
ncbi:MAG: histidine kinase [Lachnospiraceae bacterium]|nr:histidine kinase [Lachnospiraceae bacterium]